MTQDLARQGSPSPTSGRTATATRRPSDRLRLHRRRRSEGLRRAHRRARQHPHARLRHSPRVRIGEGDAYNHAMIDQRRATSEQSRLLQEGAHLEAAGFGPGPGHRHRRGRGPADGLGQSQRGGYSTSAGFIAEVAVTESNFLGRGQYVSAARVGRPVQPRMGRRRSPSPISSTSGSPRASTSSTSNRTRTLGDLFQLDDRRRRCGAACPITDELTVQPNYSIYESQVTIRRNTRTATIDRWPSPLLLPPPATGSVTSNNPAY